MVFLILAISLSTIFYWFKNRFLMGTGESGLPFYNIDWQWQASRWAWKTPGLGNVNGIITASSPTYFILSRLRALGAPSFLVQALFLLFFFFMAGVAVYFLTKELFPKLKSKFLMLAVLFYWFNPITLVNVWRRFLYNYMAFWAFLPLALLMFLKGVKRKDYRFAIITAFLSVVFSYALSSTVFNILLWALFFYVFLFYFILKKNLRVFLIKYITLILLSFVLFNFWWLSQLANFVLSPSLGVSVLSFFSTQGNLSTLQALSRRLGNFIYITRLMHASFFQASSFSWARYFEFPPLVFLEFAVATLIFWLIYKFIKFENLLFLGLFYMITLFLVKGANPPLGEIFQTAFVKIKTLQVFRNPLEKFGFLLSLSSAPLFAFGVSEFSKKLKSIKWKRGFISLGFFYVLVFLGFPFWTGLVFTSTEKRGGELRKYEVKAPAYYRETNEWFKRQGGNFRFISLPLGGEGMTYSWDKPYSGVELSSILFETPNVSFNTTIPYYNELVSEITNYQLDKTILRFAPFINTKYIVLRRDIDYKKRRMADPETVERKLEEWAKEGLIAMRYEAGKLTVYEVNENWFWPKIYATPKTLISNEVDLAKLTKFVSQFPSEKMAVVDYRYLSEGTDFRGSWVIKADEIFSPQVTFAMRDLTDEDLMARLFYVKHLPDKWFYFLVRIKEKLLTPPKNNYSAWILYKTGILGKRAVEVYKLKTFGRSEKIVSRAEDDYMKELNNLAPTLSGVVGGTSPVASVVRESLLYQLLLLERANSKASQVLSDLLLELKIKPQFKLPDTQEGGYFVYHFEIPKAGKYRLAVNKDIGRASWFLDGRSLPPLYEKGVSENLIFLEKGAHEVAFLDQETKTENSVIEKDDLVLDEDVEQKWTMDLPDIPTIYKIEFDYRFKEGRRFQIQFEQDIDKGEAPVFSTQMTKDEFFHDWRHWEAEFNPSVGASSGVLSMAPSRQEICEKSWWRKKVCREEVVKFNVEIRNFRVSKVVQPDVFFATEIDFLDQAETSVGFVKVNPTLYKARVNKQTNEPEILVFSELFNSGWEAVFEDGTKVPENKHFLVNAYANGWMIDKPGDYEITIKFAPQDLLEKGKKISIISFLGGLVFLGVLIWRKRKR